MSLGQRSKPPRTCQSFSRAHSTRSDWCRFKSVRIFKTQIQTPHIWAKHRRNGSFNFSRKTILPSLAFAKARGSFVRTAPSRSKEKPALGFSDKVKLLL